MTRGVRRWCAWSAIVSMACWLASGAACTGSTRGEVAGPANAGAPPLRAGMPTTSPPFASLQDTVLVGLEPDLARELGRELGRGIEFRAYDFEDLIPALIDGKVDVVMAGLTTTPLRAMRIGFTQSYLTTGQRMLVRAGDVAALGSPDLVRGAGARLGALRASTGEQYARAHLAPAPLRAYATLTDAVGDLADGILDVVVCDAPVVAALAAARPAGDLVAAGELLTHEKLAWAVGRHDDRLRRDLDAALDRMRADGRLDEIVNRWAGTAR